MKKLIGLLVLMLDGCAQLQHGQQQPVITKSAKEGIYYTSCGGAVEDWPSCYDKASKTCNKRYIILTKGDNNRGTNRDITFQCEK